MGHGQVPYRDFHIEYPPGVLPIIFLAQPVGLLIGSYALSYALIVGVFIYLVLFDVYKRWGKRQVLWLSCLLLIFGRFVFFQLDIFSAVALYFAIKSVNDHRYGHSAVLFAIATLIKGYPLVCLPAIILSLPKNKIRKYFRTLALVLAVGVLPFFVIILYSSLKGDLCEVRASDIGFDFVWMPFFKSCLPESFLARS